MKQVTLGRSELTATNVGLELSPMLQMNFAECRELMDRAMDAGITLYDIGLLEEELQKRIGHAIAGRRNGIVLAGSFAPCEPKKFKKDLETLLRGLKTDYIDLCQIHDPDYLPRQGDSEGFFDALTQAKEAGYIRSIGITTGSFDIALHALEFGWYDTLQFPWTIDSPEEEADLIDFSHMAAMGTISVPPEELPKTKEELAKDLEWLEQQEQHTGLWLAKEGAGLQNLFELIKL